MMDSVAQLRLALNLDSPYAVRDYAKRPPCCLCGAPIHANQSFHNNGRMVHWNCELREMGITPADARTQYLAPVSLSAENKAERWFDSPIGMKARRKRMHIESVP